MRVFPKLRKKRESFVFSGAGICYFKCVFRIYIANISKLMLDYRQLFEQGRYKEALDLCDQAIEEEKVTEEHYETLLYDVQLIFFKRFDSYFWQRQFPEAAGSMDELLELFPGSLQAQLYRAMAWSEEGYRWKEAGMLDKAMGAFALDMENEELNTMAAWEAAIGAYYLATVHESGDMLADAISRYAKCSAAPSDERMRRLMAARFSHLIPDGNFEFLLATMHYDRYRFVKDRKGLDECIAMVEKELAARPALPYHLVLLGMALLSKGKSELRTDVINESIRHLREAIRLLPAKPGFHCSLAESLIALAETEDALGAPQNLISMVLNEALRQYDMAITLEQSGQWYFDRARVYERMAAYEHFPHIHEALRNWLRAHYLQPAEKDWAQPLVNNLLQYFNLPNTVARLHAQHPSVRIDPKWRSLLPEAQHSYRNFQHMQYRIFSELQQSGSPGDAEHQFTLYRALTEHLGGDPIAAFALHDSALDATALETDLQHQYYYLVNANFILHDEEAAIKAFAVQHARDFMTGPANDVVQLYYAACILLLNGECENAAGVFEDVSRSGYWPASFRLAECYQRQGNNAALEQLAKNVHLEGYRNEMLADVRPDAGAIEELLTLLKKEESQAGWMILETCIIDKERAAAANNIPLSRLLYNREDNQRKTRQYAPITLMELLEMKPGIRSDLAAICRERMADIFPFYENEPVLDERKTAEDLYAHMLRELKAHGRILINDYTSLLRYCLLYGKLHAEAYFTISTYLNLKYLVLDKSGKGFTINNLTGNMLSTIVGPLLLLMTGPAIKIPMSILSKIVLDSAEQEAREIERMNFDYFMRYYSELQAYTEDELAALLKDHNNSTAVREAFENVYALL
jgi:hypothetical protein